MTRRQRQIDQLRALCADGHVGRAVDLAFEHFASFGRDDDLIALFDLFVRAAGESGERGPVLRRLDELRATGPPAGPAPCAAR